MENDLKKKVINGTSWSLAEKMMTEMVNLIITVILSRLILPEAYGTIALIQVFISVSVVFVSSGMGSAIVQKKDATEADYSTAFVMNVVLGIVLYFVLFFCAGFIADFYDSPNMISMVRVLSLRIPIASIYNIQHAYVQKRMEFKKFFFSSLGGTILSGIVGICLAYKGLGAWALIAATLVDQLIDSIVLFFTTKWIPKLYFSLESWKPLFLYAYKVVLANFVTKIGDEVYSLVIGKAFTKEALAYNTKGKKIPFLLSESLSSTIMSVMFPALSSLQEKRDQMISMARESVKVATYLISPIMVGFAATAPHLIPFVFSETWIKSVPFLQIYALTYILQPLHSIDQKLLNAIGRSDLTLRVEAIKRIVGISFLIISIIIVKNVYVAALTYTMISICEFLLNSRICKREFGYGFFLQLSDIIPSVVTSLVMGTAVYFVGCLIDNHLVSLFVQVIAGVGLYILISIITRNKEFLSVLNLVKKYKNKEE